MLKIFSCSVVTLVWHISMYTTWKELNFLFFNNRIYLIGSLYLSKSFLYNCPLFKITIWNLVKWIVDDWKWAIRHSWKSSQIIKTNRICFSYVMMINRETRTVQTINVEQICVFKSCPQYYQNLFPVFMDLSETLGFYLLYFPQDFLPQNIPVFN